MKLLWEHFISVLLFLLWWAWSYYFSVTEILFLNIKLWLWKRFFIPMHSCTCNFFWLMGKQVPHQSFSPGPIICKHQMKPYIAMQIIVPRDLQYNHPVTRKVKRRGNYHNGPQNIHKRMLRGLYGRFHHHSKDMLAFLWKCALLGRERCCWLRLGETWSSGFLVAMDWTELFIFSHLNCEVAN